MCFVPFRLLDCLGFVTASALDPDDFCVLDAAVDFFLEEVGGLECVIVGLDEAECGEGSGRKDEGEGMVMMVSIETWTLQGRSIYQ